MAYLSPVSVGALFRPNGPTQRFEGFGMEAGAQIGQEAPARQPHSQQQQEQARQQTGNRSMFSTVTQRIGNIRNSNRQAMQEREETRMDRLLRDINRMREAAMLRAQFQGGGMARTEANAQVDLEAQNAVNANSVSVDSTSRRGAGGKSRREREEGAALFGPNLANYFGSGSSSSGAVITPIAAGGGGGGVDNLAALSATQRKSRLGSRGRARGASLSGLGGAFGDGLSGKSAFATSGADQGAGEPLTKTMSAGGGNESMAMAEGIELDTLKRWIDRSILGGALEITNPENGQGVAGDAASASTLCSTLQSYVNLKRNTVKLNVQPSEGETLPRLANTPTPTHLLQFEYDCASPYAGIQIFARASRKHGSWINWAAAREAAGLPTDTCVDGGSDTESLFFAERSPPPHVLGWPIYTTQLGRGFGKPLKAAIALQLDYYAPPKAEHSTRMTEAAFGNRGEVETPGLEAGKRLGDEPTTPAATAIPVPDPLSRVESTVVPLPGESKEAKAAREKAERETLKLTVIVEALDADGRPLSEPNLQTTYLRVASLPLRAEAKNDEAVVDAANVITEGQDSGPVQDIALPADVEGREVLADDAAQEDHQQQQQQPPHQISERSSSATRIWSLQVEGQEAEIGPHRFQLQELYGLSSRPPPPQQEEHQDQEIVEGDTDTPAPAIVDFGQEGAQTECLICLSAPPSTLLLPCTHGLCLECAVQLRESVKAVRQTERRRGRRPKRKYACPVCRRAYTNMLHLSTADEKKTAQANASV